MSQDLLAAFGVSENQTEKSKNLEFPSFDHVSSEPVAPTNQLQPASSLNDEDDWGEFEGAIEDKIAPSIPAVVQSVDPRTAQKRYQYDLNDLGTQEGKLPANSGSGSNFDLLSLDTASQAPSAISHARIPGHVAPKDPDVLFDASDEDSASIDDFDDFGVFEDFKPPKQSTDVAKTAAPIQSAAHFDLLGLDDDELPPPQQKQNIQKVEDGSFAFGHTTTSNSVPPRAMKPSTSKTVVVVKSQSDEPVADEKWEDFEAWGEDEDEKPESSTKGSSKAPPESKRIENVNLLGFANVNATNIDRPPTTIPPPAVVLSIFPSIFEIIEKELLLPLTAQSQVIRKTILSDSKTVAYLHGYLAVIVVLGHVVAGRKSRWKRDTLLAQSMRIGPASAGRLSGMKVTSIDKSESNREDREVAEVLRVWNSQVGRLRSLVNEAKKLTDSYLPNIPELRDTMPIKTALEADGGISSTKACALCGLKRNERVGKVDLEVEDSFGEWWDEKVIMHRACRNFWSKHEASLRQR